MIVERKHATLVEIFIIFLLKSVFVMLFYSLCIELFIFSLYIPTTVLKTVP